MSALQGQSPEKIPSPAKKFVAAFIDQTDIITDRRETSIDGETLYGAFQIKLADLKKVILGKQQ